MHIIIRKFLTCFPAWPSSVLAVAAWLGLFITIFALFLAAVVGTTSSGRLVLSARSLDDRAGLRFPMPSSESRIVGRLQAMNGTPVHDGGLAVQWHLMGWPNQWFDRFPLTVDQNISSTRGLQTEESSYWLSQNAASRRSAHTGGACPQANPSTPSSYRLWDSAMSNPGQHLGELVLSDSMVETSHVDLAGAVVLAQGTESRFRDADAHGTHVAGVVAALRNGEGVVGVIPGMQIKLFPLPVRQLRNGPRIEGESVFENLDAILASLLAHTSSGEKPTRVILLSWAFFESDGLSPEFVEGLETRIRQLLDHDVAVVVPAGNLDGGRSEANGRIFPAAWAGQFRDLRGSLLPVSSLDMCSRPSWFSNLAANDLGSVLMAPGERIFSTLPGNDYGFLSGTSAAAAQVAAVLAMTSAQFPDVEMKTQVHTLIRTSVPLSNQQSERLVSFEAPSLVQGLMAEFGWIARY